MLEMHFLDLNRTDLHKPKRNNFEETIIMINFICSVFRVLIVQKSDPMEQTTSGIMGGVWSKMCPVYKSKSK